MAIKRQIITMGGGGFLMEPENPLFEDYIVKAVAKPNPAICFIPTASGDGQDRIDAFYRCFRQRDCRPSHLSLFRGEALDMELFLLSQDIIYVGGGNTRNMLVLWREWGLDQMILKAYQAGTLLCGVSAGSICWYEQGITDSIPGSLTVMNCLGLLKGSNCPHFDGESGRRSTYTAALKAGIIAPGIAADDGCALHYIDESFFKSVSSRAGAGAYLFTREQDILSEATIATEYLGH